MLPLGLAHNVKLKRDIAERSALKWSDVVYDPNDAAVKVRREMESAFGRRNASVSEPPESKTSTEARVAPLCAYSRSIVPSIL